MSSAPPRLLASRWSTGRLRGPLVACCLGLLFVLLVCEVSLRFTSRIYWRSDWTTLGPLRPLPEEALSCADCPKIMVLGDSYTDGLGVAGGNDYPSVLQQRLLEQRMGSPVVVANLGMSAANSSIIRENLIGGLERFSLDLVVVLAGGSNALNLYRYYSFCWSERGWSTVETALNELRVLRLLRFAWATSRRARTPAVTFDAHSEIELDSTLDRSLAWLGPLPEAEGSAAQAWARGVAALRRQAYEQALGQLRAGMDPSRQPPARLRWGEAFALRALGRLPEAESAWHQGLEEQHLDPLMWYGLGELALHRGRVEEAIELFKSGVGMDPSYSGNHCGLANASAHRSAHGEALLASRRGIEADPDDLRCYPALVHTSRLLGTQGASSDFLAGFADRSELAARHVPLLDEERRETSAWMRGDLEDMVTRSRAAGARVLFLEYPIQNEANAVLRSVAQDRGVAFQPVLEVFEGKLADGVPHEQLYLPDLHCSVAGNALLADIVMDAIRAQELLPGGPEAWALRAAEPDLATGGSPDAP